VLAHRFVAKNKVRPHFARGCFGVIKTMGMREDNQALTARLREVHEVVDELNDIATASLIENWIDETERRTWFLFESSRNVD